MIGVEAELRRQIERHVQSILSMCHQVLEASIRLRRRAEANVLAHRPQPVAVHVAMDAARERILARPADVARGIAPGQVLGSVDRLHGDAGVQSGVSHGLLLRRLEKAFEHGQHFGGTLLGRRVATVGQRQHLGALEHAAPARQVRAERVIL